MSPESFLELRKHREVAVRVRTLLRAHEGKIKKFFTLDSASDPDALPFALSLVEVLHTVEAFEKAQKLQKLINDEAQIARSMLTLFKHSLRNLTPDEPTLFDPKQRERPSGQIDFQYSISEKTRLCNQLEEFLTQCRREEAVDSIALSDATNMWTGIMHPDQSQLIVRCSQFGLRTVNPEKQVQHGTGIILSVSA